jgi:MoxR-like ATPase
MPAKKTTTSHPLAKLIPAAVFGPVLDMQLLKYAHASGQAVMMYGETGPGKTSAVLAYCALNGYPLVTIMGNGGVDPNVFWVVPMPDPEMGFKLVETDILTAVRHGNCVIYIDEINFMPAKVIAPLNSLLDKRRQVTVMELGNELVNAGPNILVVCSYNPDYEGTRPLNAALRNRFPIKMHWDYDTNVEDALLCMPVMGTIAKKLREKRPAEIRTPVSTNMLNEFEQIAIDVSLDFAIGNFMAAFAPIEREAVGGVLEMHRHILERQLRQMDAGEEMTEEEDD